MKIKLSTLRLIIYLIITILFFFIIALPVLKGNLSFKFYFDTDVYENIYKSGHTTLLDIVKNKTNYLGPFLIQYLISPNYFIIFLLNILIFVFSYRLIIKSYDVNRNLLLFFFTISPFLFISLLSLNKEIVSLLSLSFYVAYFSSHKRKYLVFAIILSILVRWQFSFFILLFTLLESKFNPFYKKRFLSFLLLLAIISLSYTLITINEFKLVRDAASNHFLLYGKEGIGTYRVLTNIQEKGGYFLVFIPKTLHLLFSYFSKIKLIFEGNYVINIGQSFASLLLVSFFIFKYLRKKIERNNNLFYMAMIYCLLFAITPIHVPRYLFPFYLLLAIFVSVRKKNDSVSPSLNISNEPKEENKITISVGNEK
jgi:hypothetical protein